MAYYTPEQKKKAAAELKKVVPSTWRYSLSIEHASGVLMTIWQGPKALAMRDGVQKDHETVWPFRLDERFEGELLETVQKIFAILNDGNHDNSDIQSDYFDRGWYVTVRAGRWDRDYIAID